MKEASILSLLLFMLLACSKDPSGSTLYVNIKKASLLEGKNIQENRAERLYYDIQVTGNEVALLDYRSDTVMQIYDLKAPNQLKHHLLRGKESNELFNPIFTKSDTANRENKSIFSVIDNKIHLTRINSADNLTIQSTRLPHDLINSIDYNITRTEIFAVPLNTMAISSLFYFYELGKYYYQNPPKLLESTLMNIPHIFLGSVVVNEKKNRIASGLRFINALLIYDTDAQLKKTITFGDSIQTPLLDASKKQVEIEKTSKYIIDMCSTDNYIYCLYDGSGDYSNVSTLIVFNWDGKLIATKKTDKSLRKIAADSSDTHLYAIAENLSGGRDVIEYSTSNLF